MGKHGIELELEEIEIDEMDNGTLEEIAEDKALKAFIEVGDKYGILGKTKQEIIEKYGV